MNHRPISVFIACSLDGFIAGPDGNIDFLSIVEKPGEDYGYSAFIQTIDTVIMGRKTYEKVLSFGIGFPHADKKCYVLSHSRSGTDQNVTFISGDIPDWIGTVRREPGKGIYCDGGAATIASLMRHGLIDRFVISIIPVILGNGIRLFESPSPFARLELNGVKRFDSGLVQLDYRKPA